MLQDIKIVESVALRHDKKLCILVVEAKMAWEVDAAFYYGNEKVWLADKVLKEYIKEVKIKLGNKKCINT